VFEAAGENGAGGSFRVAPARLAAMADTVYVTGRRGADEVYHEPVETRPGEPARTTCGLVVGGVTPLMRRELAARTARPCSECYWIPAVAVERRDRSRPVARSPHWHGARSR
jgi:hypothetical protein